MDLRPAIASSSAPSHHFTIRIDTSPELDVDRLPLIEQHASAVECRVAGGSGLLQEGGVGRIGDDVGDHDLVGQRIEVDGSPHRNQAARAKSR